MRLDKTQAKHLQEALLDSFPSHDDLTEMVEFGLGENLDAIVPKDKLKTVVFQLIKWAQAQGRVEELLEAAQKSNPSNPMLQEFIRGLSAQQAPDLMMDAAFQDQEPTRSDIIERFLQNVDHGALDCVIARLGLEARVTRRATYLERVSEAVMVADNTKTVGLRRLSEEWERCANIINPR